MAHIHCISLKCESGPDYCGIDKDISRIPDQNSISQACCIGWDIPFWSGTLDMFSCWQVLVCYKKHIVCSLHCMLPKVSPPQLFLVHCGYLVPHGVSWVHNHLLFIMAVQWPVVFYVSVNLRPVSYCCRPLLCFINKQTSAFVMCFITLWNFTSLSVDKSRKLSVGMYLITLLL